LKLHKRIFITGGASGLGKAVALKFAGEGYRVCIGDIHQQRGREVEKALKLINNDSLYLDCNVTKPEDLENVRDTLLAQWGGVDIVVNNAGVGGSAGHIEDVSMEHWQTAVDINLLGVVRGCKTFTPLFKHQGEGYFVNIASGGGYINAPFMAAYNVSKAGVISLSETLSAEFYEDNIGVSVVCPGFFHTNLTESLHSQFEGLKTTVNEMMAASKVEAEHVAESIFSAYQKNKFMVMPHRTERYMWYLKRLTPSGFRALMSRHGRKLFS